MRSKVKMIISLPIKPLSINECWQGQRFKTKKYKQYEKELLCRLPKVEVPPPPYTIIFEFGISKLTDWDNPIKALQDIMQKKYGFNDRDINKAVVRKTIVKKGKEFFKVELMNIKEERI